MRLLDDMWAALMAWSSRADDREMSDEARRWADEDAGRTPLPVNVGEWKASMEIAFEAGRRYERLRHGVNHTG